MSRVRRPGQWYPGHRLSCNIHFLPGLQQSQQQQDQGMLGGRKEAGVHLVEAGTLQHMACASVLLAPNESPQTGQPNLRFPLCPQVTVTGGSEQEPTQRQARGSAENCVGHWKWGTFQSVVVLSAQGLLPVEGTPENLCLSGIHQGEAIGFLHCPSIRDSVQCRKHAMEAPSSSPSSMRAQQLHPSLL